MRLPPIVLPLLLAACAAGGPALRHELQEASQREPFVYRLRGGERLRITLAPHIHESDSDSSIVGVDDRGYLAPPLLGPRAPALGMTVRELEDRLEQTLPSVRLRVEVVDLQFCVYDDCHQFVDRMTVAQALEIVGMTYYAARLDDIQIRNGNVVIIGVSSDTPVYPGDLIDLPERYF